MAPRRGLGLPVCGYALLGGALVWLLLVLVPRVRFGFPLEWMEGGVLQHVERLLSGQPLYAPPSADFTAFVYMPGAYLAMAPLAVLFGAQLPVLRAVSLLAFAATLSLVYRMAVRRCHRGYGGAVAAAWFALGFGYTGAFMDLARVDAVWLACLCAGAERMSAQRTRAGLLWLALAVLVKQQALLLFGPMCGFLLFQHGVRALRWVWPSACLLLTGITAWALWSDGWLLFYAFELPAGHGMSPSLLFSYLLVDVCLYLPVLAFFTLRAWAGRGFRVSPFGVLVALSLLVSALGRAHPGGHDNVRLPGFALLCVVAGSELALRARCPPYRTRRRWALGFALLAQAAILYQSPGLHRPPAASERAFEALAAATARCAGRDAPQVAAFDWGPPLGDRGAHTMALSDLRLSGAATRFGPYEADLERFFSRRPADVVVLGESFAALTRAVEAHYSLCQRMPAPPMTTGYQPPPQRLYRFGRSAP